MISMQHQKQEHDKAEGGPPCKKQRVAASCHVEPMESVPTGAATRSATTRNLRREKRPQRRRVRWNESEGELINEEDYETNAMRNCTDSRRQNSYESNINSKKDNNMNNFKVHTTVFQLVDPASVFDDYNESDVWFTGEEYDSFMIERIRTVGQFRSRTSSHSTQTTRRDGSVNGAFNRPQEGRQGEEKDDSDDRNDDDHECCMRGLEPFQDDVSHGSFFSKRDLHKSTVIVEQCRQAMLGLKDPERFRLLVQSQSSLAQFRAIQLAAIDQHEVYPNRPLSSDQRSILTAGAPTQQESPFYASRGVNHLEVTTLSSVLQRRMSLPSATSSKDNSTPSQCLLRSSQSYQSLSARLNNYNSIRPGRDFVGSRDKITIKEKDVDLNQPGEVAASTRVTNITSHVPNTTTMMGNIPDFFSSAMLRQFQENNARRLMEIYKPLLESDSTMGGVGKHAHSGNPNSPLSQQSVFRFSLRRDSLSSLKTGPSTTMLHRQQDQQKFHLAAAAAAMISSSRFPIRRDSLSHVHSSSS